jgi:DNA-binding LacI/PurR family transcriptional regulator
VEVIHPRQITLTIPHRSSRGIALAIHPEIQQVENVKPLRLRSHAEQTADFLRDGLRRGTWSGSMPGVLRLEKELGVNRNTLEAALQLLENDGWLAGQGAGKRRHIVSMNHQNGKVLRLGILTLTADDRGRNFPNHLLHSLQEAGHAAFFSRKPMSALGMEVGRVSRMVQQEDADAWVVVSGPRDLLEWFEKSGLPVFAVFGRRAGLPIAGSGPDKIPAVREVVGRLVAMGHRRIVMLNHRLRRLPSPGPLERAFLDELEARGLPTSPFNMPDLVETAENFHECLEGLFRHTPPTALIADEATYFLAAMQFCANQGLLVPGDVSLVCMDADLAFALFNPGVAHIAWDPVPVVRQAVKWANLLAKGRDMRRQCFTKARFVEGGTMGPAPVGAREAGH